MKQIRLILALGLSLLLLGGCASAKQQTQVDYIGAEKAKNIALEAAGLPASEVLFTSTELDSRNGLNYYEVEFTAGGLEYEYDIDALTGAIIEADTPSSPMETQPVAETTPAPSPAQTTETAAPAAQLTPEEAKAAVLEHAGFTEDQVTFLKSKLDKEDGRQVYELEFYNTDSYRKYEYEIDAATGEIIRFEQCRDLYSPQLWSSVVTPEEAKEIALAQVPGADASHMVEFETDQHDGSLRYEGKIIYNNTEYEFEIDGYSGAICEWDSEPCHDNNNHH